MGINEIEHTIYPYTVGREDCKVLPRSFKTVAKAQADHRWCLVCRHSNGVLDVKRLRQMRDVYLQRGLDGNEKPEDQRELANINETLMLLQVLEAS